MGSGVQFVMTHGVLMMPELPVGSLDLQPLVSYSIHVHV